MKRQLAWRQRGVVPTWRQRKSRRKQWCHTADPFLLIPQSAVSYTQRVQRRLYSSEHNRAIGRQSCLGVDCVIQITFVHSPSELKQFGLNDDCLRDKVHLVDLQLMFNLLIIGPNDAIDVMQWCTTLRQGQTKSLPWFKKGHTVAF